MSIRSRRGHSCLFEKRKGKKGLAMNSSSPLLSPHAPLRSGGHKEGGRGVAETKVGGPLSYFILYFIYIYIYFYESAMPSMSRIRTAICARFAASATRFRSRMKTSVLGVLTCAGGGGGANDCVDVGPPAVAAYC